MAGHAPGEYADLRRWPVREVEGVKVYSVQVFLAQRAHTQRILDFLVGFRRYGPAAGLRLIAWEHVQCVRFFSERRLEMMLPAARRLQPRMVPDAEGIVVNDRLSPPLAFRFWLEVDRGTEQGAALWRKLGRYYHLGRNMYRHWCIPMLLFVVDGVDGSDERRLQALCRRFRRLDEYYRYRLTVLLARADRLGDGRGRLNPARPVWRTPYSDEGVSPFQPSGPAESSRLDALIFVLLPCDRLAPSTQ